MSVYSCANHHGSLVAVFFPPDCHRAACQGISRIHVQRTAVCHRGDESRDKANLCRQQKRDGEAKERYIFFPLVWVVVRIVFILNNNLDFWYIRGTQKPCFNFNSMNVTPHKVNIGCILLMSSECPSVLLPLSSAGWQKLPAVV